MAFEREKEFGLTKGVAAYFELVALHPELKDQRVMYIARRAVDFAMNNAPKVQTKGLIPSIVSDAIVSDINRQTLSPVWAESQTGETS